MKRTMVFSLLCVLLLLAGVSQQFSQNNPIPEDRAILRRQPTPRKSPGTDDNDIVRSPDNANRRDPASPFKFDSPYMAKLKDLYPGRNVEIRRTGRADLGYSGSGVVVVRSAEKIVIDTTPCSDQKDLLSFHKVYKESEISDINCKGKKYPRSKVRQQ
jgi:hypothetical protein